MTVNRIPTPKREPAPDVSGKLGASNEALKALRGIDTQVSKSQRNTVGIALPSPTGSTLDANVDEGIDLSNGVMEREIVDEDIFEEFYAPRNGFELSKKHETKSAENLLPCKKELDNDMEAIVPEATAWDSVGDQLASDRTLCPAASPHTESQMGNSATESLLKDSDCDAHPGAFQVHDGIKEVNSTCNELINAGMNDMKTILTFCRRLLMNVLTSCHICRGVIQKLLLIQTLLKQARSIRMVHWRCWSLTMFNL
jgi:hypothetical protein